ncbi:MAG: TolC family protein [Planctomycetaceae bacterium]
MTHTPADDKIVHRLLACGLAVFLAGCQSPRMSATESFVTEASYPADYTEPAVVSLADAATPPTADQPTGRRNGIKIPKQLPGAEAAPLQLPPLDRSQSTEDRRSVLRTVFPELQIPEDHNADQNPQLPEVTLSELQSWALASSPVIRTAAAKVERARGVAVQAGLYPNPTVGYEGDSLGTARTMGYNGVTLTQEFVTAGKLSLAQSAAMMEMQAARQELVKARIALASDVRRGFFKVVIAQERARLNRALAQLAGEAYEAHIDLVAGGEVAPYEALQLRVFAQRVHNDILRADNDLQASWRQLAATLGVPDMARHRIIGSIEQPIPEVNYDAALSFLLTRHSDLAAASSRVSGAGYELAYQEAVPIPNITVYGALQHDDTTPLNDIAANIQVSLPVPLFNKNEGNISAAYADVVKANQTWFQTRNDLVATLAEAYNRYSTSRSIAASYRDGILKDQVNAYRGASDHFRAAGVASDFAEVVVAQQSLSAAISEYLQSLQDQWLATVDLAEVLQVDDFYAMESQVGSATFESNSDAPFDAGSQPAAPFPTEQLDVPAIEN